MTERSEALPIEGLRARVLHPDDAAAGFALSAEAGWNQAAADWRLMLEFGEGVGIADMTGELIATALVLPYAALPPRPAVGWIGMVLVTGRYRQRGLATWLLRRCLAICEARGLVPMLDATPAGREVYRRIGFADGMVLTRFFSARPQPVPTPTGEVTIRTLRADDSSTFAEFDGAALGADRTVVAQWLSTVAQDALVAQRKRRLSGFAIRRAGRIASYLGPLLADDPDSALALLRGMLVGVRGPIVLDVPDTKAEFQRVLLAAGFEPQRPFTRMHKGSQPPAGSRIFAIAGPELG